MRFSVNIRGLLLMAICLGFLSLHAAATTYYVNINNSDPTPPYTSWATAAINIQDAVNIANAGDTVLVTNGAPPAQPNGIAIYRFSGATAGSYSNRVAVLQPINLQSVNGPALTWIEGSFDSARCVFLTNGAVLSGFTLTNGFAEFGSGPAAEGGGVCAQSTNAIITNCIIMDCSADYGAAAYSGTLYSCLIESNYYNTYIGVGAYTSVLNNCFIINNNTSAGSGGGAAYSILNNCVLSNNAAEYGGAAYDCVLSNCTLVKNSSTYDGGACFGGILNNCILTNNSAAMYGGAAAGGDFSGNGNYPIVLNDCLVSSNAAPEGGGVAGGYDSSPTNCLLNNCTLMFNRAADNGGGAYGGVLTDCLIISNTANVVGGGTYSAADYSCDLFNNNASGSAGRGGGASGGSLTGCIVSNNIANSEGGGVGGVTYLTNCLIINNMVNGVPLGSDGGLGGAAWGGYFYNCTIVFNFGYYPGLYGSIAQNCIVYDNTSGVNTNWFDAELYNCCTFPLPSPNYSCFTNLPLFVNLTNNFQLQSNSPCINAGNNAYVTSATDLAGNPRIQGGTVDMGAYEYQSPTSVISYAWLQQYGLPTDGSVDFTNFDGTAFNVYQDWVAGLNPTNSASVLVMLSPSATNNTSGIKVSWQSVSGILYNLQRSTNLPAFSTIQTNLTGQAGTTSYTDTSATNNWPYFYRVSVQAP